MADADPQKTFNVHDAKTQLSKLMDRAHAGEEILLAKAGQPWARLVPLDHAPAVKPKRQPGGLKVLREIPDSVWFDPLPEDELELWEGKRLDKYFP
ncbi:type II toxin-antitoxin system Phd/YefM family antitoxin [Sphingomonas sp. M1-B02]|uniref:type II toxin-antitoxin system Phd/YefM family antitoxin n=1 Tax=Sphingomonas sp. M1-B02 TaxID=3114300 RepID=UPI00223FEECD|nr:type II toxin-antitoxin system prevent-host-death family antitoxin [Sphingomonas sp. S6-11]UZK64732.1 type II toxin-antitoxin system prevent-host-death family antitoxin [Sphingomonas sp. S6-11]